MVVLLRNQKKKKHAIYQVRISQNPPEKPLVRESSQCKSGAAIGHQYYRQMKLHSLIGSIVTNKKTGIT